MLVRKDGTIYRLPGPNPIMNKQDLWNEDKIILHNWDNNEEEVVEEASVPFVEKTAEKVRAWCLPAQIKEYTDPLYGEVRNRIEYGNKFNFELVIVEQNDIQLKFWTNSTSLTKKSIIYFDKRWWTISNVNNLIYDCLPSTETPSF